MSPFSRLSLRTLPRVPTSSLSSTSTGELVISARVSLCHSSLPVARSTAYTSGRELVAYTVGPATNASVRIFP